MFSSIILATSSRRYKIMEINLETAKGQRNVATGTAIGLGVLVVADSWRQKVKSWFGAYETVTINDPDATAGEETGTV